jgi:hypothetical protein
VQNDIDGNNEKGKRYKPGQYFVLKFDFSTIQYSPDHAETNRNLIMALNSSFQHFYETYAAYLDEDVTSLCGNIDSRLPSLSLQNCCWSVQRALSRAREQKNSPLTDVQGIYLLADEYDAFANNYLESPNTVEPHKNFWDSEVGRTLICFWSTVKSLCSEKIERIFITGVLPLSLSGIGSGFNIARNLSFHPHLAGLCGLTSSDLKKVLEEIRKDDKDDKNDKGDKHLSKMTKSFNGYHFCGHEKVETVYNTEACLAYLQSIVDGGDPETKTPPNSEVTEQCLEEFATSAFVIANFEKALKYDKDENFVPLKYGLLKQQFTPGDLVC